MSDDGALFAEACFILGKTTPVWAIEFLRERGFLAAYLNWYPQQIGVQVTTVVGLSWIRSFFYHATQRELAERAEILHDFRDLCAKHEAYHNAIPND